MDPQTGARVEIFYADRALATSSVQGGSGGRASPFSAKGPANWPICDQFAAYRNFATRSTTRQL